MKNKILKKNVAIIIVLLIVLVLGIVGITLALTTGVSSNVTIDTANLGVEYTGDLTLPSTTLFPIEDSEIDSNTENVLTINFTVKGVSSNPTDIPIIYDIVLSDLKVSHALKSKYLKWQLKKNGSVISTGSFAKDFDTIKDGRLTLTEIQQDLPNYDSTADSYEFKLWISESCPGDNMSECGPEHDQSDMLNKTLSGKIEAVLYTKNKQALVRVPDTSSDKSSEVLEKLGLTSNGVKDTVTDVATTDEGIWETEDDYGTTYYFRGAVENNYVKFADYYWRIVRINGDGSIRLIYDGTSAHANGEVSEDRQIGTSAYNYTYGDNAYIGYMMGMDNQCSSGGCEGEIKSTSYSQAHSNVYNSTIKNLLDNWYKINIEDAGYSDKIADVIYCNDRQIAADSSLYEGELKYGTLGYGVNPTIYAASSRLKTPDWNWKNIQQIKMTCEQKNDSFTVDDEIKGNSSLAYSIGIITVDEVLAGGGKAGAENIIYYLHTGQDYWTMSPFLSGGEWHITSNGSIDLGYLSNLFAVRPVLSLKSSVKLSGSGTMTDPYVVQS